MIGFGRITVLGPKAYTQLHQALTTLHSNPDDGAALHVLKRTSELSGDPVVKMPSAFSPANTSNVEPTGVYPSPTLLPHTLGVAKAGLFKLFNGRGLLVSNDPTPDVRSHDFTHACNAFFHYLFHDHSLSEFQIRKHTGQYRNGNIEDRARAASEQFLDNERHYATTGAKSPILELESLA